MPPDSSKKRSISNVSCDGRAPSVWRAGARYSTSCSALAKFRPRVSVSQSSAGCRLPGVLPSNASRCACRRATAEDNSALRPGASPSQNGMVGGCP
ncbi:hypothetical protein D3C81_1934870 [compost metagenome]